MAFPGSPLHLSPHKLGALGPCRKWRGLGQACCFDQLYEPWLFMECTAPILPPRAASCQWHSGILAVPGESAAGPQPHFLQPGPWPWLLGTEQPLKLMLHVGVGPEAESSCPPLSLPLLPWLTLTQAYPQCSPHLCRGCSIFRSRWSNPHPI